MVLNPPLFVKNRQSGNKGTSPNPWRRKIINHGQTLLNGGADLPVSRRGDASPSCFRWFVRRSLGRQEMAAFMRIFAAPVKPPVEKSHAAGLAAPHRLTGRSPYQSSVFIHPWFQMKRSRLITLPRPILLHRPTEEIVGPNPAAQPLAQPGK
jgi:hypothetical protein